VAEFLYDKWMVGYEGLIFRYNVDAGYFSLIDAPVRENLYDVEFVSSNDGWIVGRGSLILHWDGEKWDVARQAIGRGGPYTYDLYKVVFTEANDVWAAGCSGSEGGEYFLVYHWDGATWSDVSFPEDLYLHGCIHDVLAFSSTDVWLVGTDWYDGKEYGVVVHWDGERWNVIPELRIYNIVSMSALSSNDIWAVTRYGIVLHWNGTEWREVTQLDSAGSFSVPIIYAQGSDDIFVAGNKVWHWNGNDWTDISVSSNIEEDSKIVDMVAFPSPAFPLETWMLDSSGMIYTFHWRK
jgi:hypothetical protein